MARTAADTASILEERFNRESCEPFRLTWQQLRLLADVTLLSEYYLKEVNKTLADSDYILIPCNHFLIVVMDQDMANYRQLPDKLLEKCLYEIDDIELGDDDLDELDEYELEEDDLDEDEDNEPEKGEGEGDVTKENVEV